MNFTYTNYFALKISYIKAITSGSGTGVSRDQSVIMIFQGEQFLVRTLFNHLTLLYKHYPISICNRR